MSNIKLRIVVGCDQAGYEYKEQIKKDLESNTNVERVIDVGVDSNGSETAYPLIGIDAAEKIAKGEAHRAIVICGTGLGVAISANKVKGIRAVTAHDSFSVGKKHITSNNCQVLCMGQRVIGLGRTCQKIGLRVVDL